MKDPTTVPEALLSIATEIRTKGHYQGGPSTVKPPSEGRPACLVANNTLRHLSGNPLRLDATKAMAKRIAALTKQDPATALMDIDIVAWNDTTPTTEVLEMLEAAAKETA